MTGIMTEREWRRQAHRSRSSYPRCWGAQCMLSPTKRKTLKQDRAFHLFLFLLSLTIALLMPAFVPVQKKPAQYPQASVKAQQTAPSVRSVSTVSYLLAPGTITREVTYTRDQLLRGKLLLLDESHPLPYGVPAPNTLSIAAYGKGMIPVSDLGLKSGRETIDALARMFAGLRGRGVGDLAVWRATVSPAEQRELMLAQLREYARQMPLGDAVRRTLNEMDQPRTGDMQQEYSVEIRMNVFTGALPDERALGQTEHGRILLQNAWRYGFIRRYADGDGGRAYRFRYVGEAHATAMTYLDLSLEDYLELLHGKGTLTIEKDGTPRYVIICKPTEQSHVAFQLPANATYDASLDNMGYAVVACTLTE